MAIRKCRNPVNLFTMQGFRIDGSRDRVKWDEKRDDSVV